MKTLEGWGKDLTIIRAPEDRPPFEVDARVYEEDTYLVLSAEPLLRASEEHPIRVMTKAYGAEPEIPGTVVVRTGRPLRLLAVVHDLSQEPTCKEEWVASALESVFSQVERRGLRTLGLPFLGSVHGRVRRGRFLEILREVLERVRPPSLERLWLIEAE